MAASKPAKLERAVVFFYSIPGLSRIVLLRSLHNFADRFPFCRLQNLVPTSDSPRSGLHLDVRQNLSRRVKPVRSVSSRSSFRAETRSTNHKRAPSTPETLARRSLYQACVCSPPLRRRCPNSIDKAVSSYAKYIRRRPGPDSPTFTAALNLF